MLEVAHVELFNWLVANKHETVQDRIDKVFDKLGHGRSFTLLQYELEDGTQVQLNIGIADYEDENNVEELYFHVEVDGSTEYSSDNINKVSKHFHKTINDLKEKGNYNDKQIPTYNRPYQQPEGSRTSCHSETYRSLQFTSSIYPRLQRQSH